MKAALLSMARTERLTIGYVLGSTRMGLLNLGLSNADIESYLTTVGV